MIPLRTISILCVISTSLAATIGACGQSLVRIPAVPLPYQTTSQTLACTVTGSVANGVSGVLVKHAQVSLDDGQATGALRTETDLGGAFVLSNVAVGKHAVLVRRKGFVDSRFDIALCQQQNQPSSTSSHTDRVLLRIMPLGVIVGEVMDEAGVPVAEASVRANQYRAGRLVAGVTATTNDQGMYRLYGLRPGDYYISAAPDPSAGDAQLVTGDSPSDYLTTFYPQTSDVRAATPIPVQPGSMASGINIQLRKSLHQSASVLPVSTTSSSASLTAQGADGEPLGETPQSQAGSTPASAAETTVGRSAVSGIVVNELTHEPLRHAKVTFLPANGNSSVSYATQTGMTGYFRIQGIEPGKFHAMVERAGFLRTPHLSNIPRRLPAVLALKPKHELQNIVLQVMPGSVVTGRVVDLDGEPAPDVHVQAMRYGYVLGKARLQSVAMSKTNDLGEYRLYGLSRGKYYISATNAVEGNMPARSATTFFANAVDLAAATPIAVNEGTQVGGVDLTPVVPSWVDIRGTVSCSSGSVSRQTVVALSRQGSDAELASTSTAGIDSQNRFHFRGVAPGAYTLSASFTDQHGRYGGMQAIEVRNTEINDIELSLNKAVTMSGRIDIEGSRQYLNLTSLRVLLEPESDFLAGSLVGEVKPDGSFSLNGALPSEYTLSIVGLPDEYYVKRVQMGMEEIAGRRIDLRHAPGPIDFLVSSFGGTISGTVLDSDHHPAVGVNVALIPDPPRPDVPDLYKVLPSNPQGQFTISGVAPGHYQLFAIEGSDANAYLDSDWVESLQDYAQELSIEENSIVTLMLKADSAILSD